MEIPLNVDLDIHEFSGSGITTYESGMTNAVVHKKGKIHKTTQRPSIDLTEDSSTISALNDRARGLYYWEQKTSLYIVHDNDVYKATQDSVAIGTITTGSERVTMLETIGAPKLVILDAENDEGWVVSTGDAVAAIASNFPTTICHGGAILDGYLFVMDEDGLIYNSAIDDPTTFPATGFLEAERENDKGVYLGKHHDHIVAFGTRTIEFFYDNANTSGSPLNRRQDISYNIGLSSGLSVWESGDVIFFLGSSPQGQISVYKIENFQVTPVPNDTLSSYLTQGLTQSGLTVILSGLSAMGNDTLLMTVYSLSSSSIVPKVTISYDLYSGLWGFWETSINSMTTFPLIAWTKRTGGQNATLSARTGEGILYNGDIIDVNDNLVPVDTTLGTSVYSSGVYETDIYSVSYDVGTNVELIVRTGQQDAGTDNWKFQSRESVVMEKTPSSQTLTIKHSDEEVDDFDAGNTIDTSFVRKESFQCSRFLRRNFQLEFSGDEQIFLKKLNIDVEAGL